MVQMWVGSPEAEDALNTLIPLLIGRGEVAKAREYVERMPAESTQRANAELRIGDALWRDYLVGMNEVRQWERDVQDPGAAKEELQAKIAARKPELEGLKSTALSILEPAVERMRTPVTWARPCPAHSSLWLKSTSTSIRLPEGSHAVGRREDRSPASDRTG